MARTTVVVMANDAAEGESPDALLEDGRRTFFRSWKFAAVLAAACALGVVAILSAHPFGSASVSERVSATLGRPASCEKVGVSVLDGKSLPVYRCTVGNGTKTAAPCFTVSGSDVRQISGGSRKLGC